jgi:hypothetical protein
MKKKLQYVDILKITTNEGKIADQFTLSDL